MECCVGGRTGAGVGTKFVRDSSIVEEVFSLLLRSAGVLSCQDFLMIFLGKHLIPRASRV